MVTKYQQVKQDFLSGRLKGCRDYFESNNYPVEAGYCYMVLDNFTKAKEQFEKVKNADIRGHWGLILLQMVEEKISMPPTYFEIRNFLEADLDIFMTYCKGEIVQQIIKYADYMAFYNLECYKFIGRAFWAHNFMEPAMYFLNKAKDKLYNDPELHYLLAYIHFTNQDFANCKKEIDTCLGILPEYAPAVMLRNKMTV
jgi:tetratricopeptide (TPR) repeat protein